MKNGLYIVATPIGNLGDISFRAVETLKEADVIACEDTRITKKLFSLLGISIKKIFMTLHDHNEDMHADKVIEYVLSGKSVALVSDAGSPLISDPGYKLIRKCREQGITVNTLPGACALICALQLSGLPTNKFLFAGFIPNKEKARLDLFKSFADLPATVVYYETAPRILKTLAAAQEVFGERELALAREISKVYEECLNGSAAELIAHFSEHEPKGEFVFMVSPAPEKTETDIDVEAQLKQKLTQMSLKSAVKEMVETYGLNKNEIYDLAVKLKNEL